MTFLFVAIPIFAISIDVIGGGGRVYFPVVTTEILVHAQHRFVAAEVEQAIQRMLDVPGIAGAGAQDVINDRQILLGGLLLKILQTAGEAVDRLYGVIVAHACSPESLLPPGP